MTFGKFNQIRQQAILEWQALQNSGQPRFLVGTGTCGLAAGAKAVLDTIQQELAQRKIDAIVTQVGCFGLCYTEPLVDIIKPGRPRISYGSVTPQIVSQLIEDYIVNDNPHPELALGTIGEGSVAGIPPLFELPMLKRQVRIVLRNCGNIDPEDIKQYIANDGYAGFIKALEMGPAKVIEEIKKSGLRGRGGAGFPTGQKWEFCRRSLSKEKYIICNADEGDPGAFMNRLLLEADPHSVLEGMLIGGYAIGATQGYIYCRAEKPLSIQRLKVAVKQMKDYGFLGESILGSGFSFDIIIREGAGAFVCGEETALMMSIEGDRGMPRPRPPFPAVSGLWGKPTNINNVETWADAAVILQRGADWFANFGTETSKGTKTFALAGKVVRTGLIEVPIGISIGDVVFEIGGGIVGGKRFKAVQTGGPSGGCIPAGMADLKMDYESLTQAGSIMGSGGMIVTDEDTCMVDLARFFNSFVQAESCGKCVPCRVGVKQLGLILTRITNGEGCLEDLEQLERLGQLIKATALCGLGQTAPNPVLTTIRYFRDEYEEHIKKHHCRAAVCAGLVPAPCTHTCPAGINVPRYIRFALLGKFNESLAVVREKVPFPATLGRVCFHPCEAKCRRGQLEEAIAIKSLKRAAATYGNGLWREKSKVKPTTGKRVAIVGAGPAGLTAAYYLAKLGHSTVVFEAAPEAGGMMRLGIPAYRLPRDILNQEIEEIKRVGVEIRTNSPVNSPEELRSYDAVFVATGAHRGMKMGVEGEDSPGVMDCVSFLRAVNLGQKVEVGAEVAVIGGGNAAIDASRMALRLGAQKVRILYRRTRHEMPASDEEVEAAVAEGVELEFLVSPVKIIREEGRLSLVSIRNRLGKVDSSGRKRPEPIPGSEFVTKCDTVIVGIGQQPEDSARLGLPEAKGGTIRVDPDTLGVDSDRVFAGGDVITGPASVIEAIAAGRQAAVSIDKLLGGEGDIEEELAPSEDLTLLLPLEEGEKRRVVIPCLKEGRLGSFAEVELGYTPEASMDEARRCLRCDLEEKEEAKRQAQREAEKAEARQQR